jgi:hypothetical protein
MHKNLFGGTCGNIFWCTLSMCINFFTTHSACRKNCSFRKVLLLFSMR